MEKNMATQQTKNEQRASLAPQIARAVFDVGVVVSFATAITLTTCCCQVRSPDGTVLVLGNCNTTELQDTCKGILDPLHQMEVETLYEADPHKGEDPDKIYIRAVVKPEGEE